MGKDKIAEKIATNVTNHSNIIMQYAPLVIGLVCLVICYLLFKKIQSLNSTTDYANKIEKQFVGFIKEQGNLNTVNNEKFNNIVTGMNHLINKYNNMPVNKNNELSQEIHEEIQDAQQEVQEVTQEVQEVQEVPYVVPQELSQTEKNNRELMPTSVIQTSFPISMNNDKLPAPISTSNKKEVEQINNEVPQQVPQQVPQKVSKNKKIIDIQTLKEETLIEEASSDED